MVNIWVTLITCRDGQLWSVVNGYSIRFPLGVPKFAMPRATLAACQKSKGHIQDLSHQPLMAHWPQWELDQAHEVHVSLQKNFN